MTLKSKRTNANDETDHDKAFKNFVDEISEDLFGNHRVFTLAELLTTYKLHLPKDKALSYTSWKLKAKLEVWFKGKIQFHDYLGNESSLVFCSEVTIGDALKRASALKNEVAHHRIMLETKPVVDNEHTILHKAVTILRRGMAEIVEMKEYPGPEGTSETGSGTYIPPLLLEFVKDLINPTASKSESALRRAKAIAECIIYSGKWGGTTITFRYWYNAPP